MKGLFKDYFLSVVGSLPTYGSGPISHNCYLLHFAEFFFTLLFFSSSNTVAGRGEGDGINVVSRGISGSASTTPEIKTTRKREGSVRWIQGDETN